MVRSLILHVVFAASLLVALTNHALLGSPVQIGKYELRSFSSPFDYGSEAYNDVFVDDGGTCFLIGTSNGPLENDFSSTREKLFLHRYEGTSLLWQKVIKDKDSDLTGKFVLNVDSKSFLIIYDRVEDSYSQDYPSFRAARVSKANGNILWDKPLQFKEWSADIGFSDIYDSFAFASDGLGNFFQIEEISNDSYNSPDIARISCYTNSGTLKWHIQVPFRVIRERWDGSAAVALAFKHDGSFTVGGETVYGGSGVTLPTLIRYSSTGKILWQKFFPGTNASAFTQICVDRNGFIYAANEVSDKRTVRRLSPSGLVQWTKTYSFAADDMQIVLGRLVMRTPSSWAEKKISLRIFDLMGKESGLVDASFQSPFPYTDQFNIGDKLTKMVIGASGHSAAIAPYYGNALVQTFRMSRKDTRPPSIRLTGSSPINVPSSGKSVVIRGTASDDVAPLRVAYRIKAPGEKAYRGWQFLSLGASSVNASWLLQEPVERRGQWLFEISVQDVALKRSSAQVVTVIKK